MSQWLQFYFQESNSPNSIDLIWLNDWGLVVASFVLGFVLYILYIIIINDTSYLKFSDHQLLETLWTTLPILLLVSMAIPSISILYLHDSAKTWTQIQNPYTRSPNPIPGEGVTKDSWAGETPPNDGLIIKVTGNQWYWTYEYTPWIPLLKNLSFDSYLIQHQDPDALNISLSNYRLINVDNELVLPAWTQIKFIISRNDVIHSFAVPRLSLKVDTIPGTSAQFNINIRITGQFTGFCIELCGTGHANIPIVIHATHPVYFCAWLIKSISLSNPDLFKPWSMSEDIFTRISTALTTLSKELLSTANYPETPSFFNELDTFMLKFSKAAHWLQNLRQALAIQYAWEAKIQHQESIFNKTAAILLWKGEKLREDTATLLNKNINEINFNRRLTDPQALSSHPTSPYDLDLTDIPTLVPFTEEDLK